MRRHNVLFVLFGYLACVAYLSAASNSLFVAQSTMIASPQNKFKNIAAGLTESDGVYLGLFLFEGPDGSKVTVHYKTFKNGSEAQRYFNKQIAKAAKLVERKKQMDTSGKVVGQRAEILVRDDEKTISAILWTEGPKFHEYFSTSRESILELEKVY